MNVQGQIGHEMQWYVWRVSDLGFDELTFACTCGAWRHVERIDPIEAFRGKVLSFSGRSLGEVVLKAGIAAGIGFGKHLETAQVDVVMWAGQA